MCPSEAVDVADGSFTLVRCLRQRNIAKAVTSTPSKGMVVARAMRTEVLKRPVGGDNADVVVAGAVVVGASCGGVGAAVMGR